MSNRYTVQPTYDVVREPDLPGDAAETGVIGWEVVRDLKTVRPGVTTCDHIESFDAHEEDKAQALAKRLNEEDGQLEDVHGIVAGYAPGTTHDADCTGPHWGACSCKPAAQPNGGAR